MADRKPLAELLDAVTGLGAREKYYPDHETWEAVNVLVDVAAELLRREQARERRDMVRDYVLLVQSIPQHRFNDWPTVRKLIKRARALGYDLQENFLCNHRAYYLHHAEEELSR